MGRAPSRRAQGVSRSARCIAEQVDADSRLDAGHPLTQAVATCGSLSACNGAVMASEPATAVARSPEPAPPHEEIGELVKLALDIAGSLQPREVIARILERGTYAVQADRATLSSIVDDQVVVEATYGRAGDLTWVGQRYSLDYFAGQPLVQKAIDTLQPTMGGRLAVEQAAPEFRQAPASVQHGAG